MLRNTLDSWGTIARSLHWGVAAIILIQVPLGFWMVEVYEEYAKTYGDDTLVMRTSNAHHTLGLMVLIIIVMRLAWRFSNVTPGLPDTLRTYQRYAARATHAFLYAILIVYPLSGWAALSAYEGEFPIFFFGYDSVPRIVPQVVEGEPFDYPFFAEIHRYLWRLGGAILLVHVSAALWHHWAAGDGILRRMWRGAKK